MTMNMTQYPVVFNGVTHTYINPYLVKKQNLSKNQVDKIIQLHIQRIALEEGFNVSHYDGQKYFDAWTQNQNELQEAWGFDVNQNYHRFWSMKGCSCPRIDNEDAYPTGYYVFSGGCDVHKHLIPSV